MKALSIVSILFLITNQGFGTIYFNDGQTHNIDYIINDDVFVDYQSPGMQTIVNLLPGGSIGSRAAPHNLTANNDSRINISGGRIWADLSANDSSQINMTSGSVWGYLYANDNSQLMMSGGGVIGDVHANGNSQLFLLQLDLPAGGWLDVFGDSRVTISGGWLTDSEGNALRDWSNNPLVINGYNFALNGVPINFGTLTKEVLVDYPRFTCTLANGGGISLRPILGDNSSIILTPEPATILLLGLGGLLLRKQSA